MDIRDKIKVCHLTSVHPPFDIRIFYKECVSLANNGFNVTLIAPINKATSKNGVSVIPIYLPRNRFKRILLVSFRMLRLALKQKAKIYHFHDPELMLCGVLLRLSGKKVIFDIHENIRFSFLSKDWLPKWLGVVLGWVYYILERVALLFYDQLVLAENSYLKYYPKSKSAVVLNYPLSKNGQAENKDFSQPLRFVYSGVIHALRGVWEMLEVIKKLTGNGWDVVLDLVGEVRPKGLKKQLEGFIKENGLQPRINIIGKVDFSEVYLYLQKADIGISLLKPIPNYKESLPTKIFEYMQHGLPIITNNFKLYKKYVEDTETGICGDINNIAEITLKIEKLLKDKELLKRMSGNGIEATCNLFNWQPQESKLLNVYMGLLFIS